MGQVRIIGTSHIAPESLELVKRTILEKEPGIVAVELDGKRLQALLQGGTSGARLRDIRRIGLKGWLFAMIGSWASKKLGAKVGVTPGSDMLGAVKAARKVDAKIALIDQDIEITLKRFSKVLTWREKWSFFVDLMKGVFFRKGVTFDLSKVPPKELIKKLLNEVKVRYPNVYHVLVEERNHFMAKKLALLAKQNSDQLIIAVVGAGHEEELVILTKKYLYELNKRDKKDGNEELQGQA